MEINRMTAQETLVGGWTPLHALDDQEQQVFAEATSRLIGAEYQPLEVRTQVVNGINYQYVANQSVPGFSAVRRVLVEIYAPISGEPTITGIKPLLLG